MRTSSRPLCHGNADRAKKLAPLPPPKAVSAGRTLLSPCPGDLFLSKPQQRGKSFLSFREGPRRSHGRLGSMEGQKRSREESEDVERRIEGARG